MKAVFVTLGCKVNQYETRILEERFAQAGIVPAEKGEKADLCIVNSCTVTASGDKKTRQMLRRLKRQNPDAVMVLTGCYPQAFPQDAAALEEAATVLNDDAASQEDVDAAAEALIRAYSELEREAQTDYSAIDFEIEYAKSMLENEGEYYESDMDAVREVLAEAEALREEAAGQDEVDQMVKAMRELRLSIRKRPQ